MRSMGAALGCLCTVASEYELSEVVGVNSTIVGAEVVGCSQRPPVRIVIDFSTYDSTNHSANYSKVDGGAPQSPQS